MNSDLAVSLRLSLSLALAALGASSCNRAVAPSHATAAAAVVTPAPVGPTRAGNAITFDPASPQLERLRTAPAIAATVSLEDFDLPAQVQAVPTRLARVALPSAGRVRQVRVMLGDRVSAGQPLLALEAPESSTLQASWRQARADSTQRRAALAKADADLSRQRDLFANRAAAQKDVLAAESELALAQALQEQAAAALDDVERRMQVFGVDRTRQDGVLTVRAPMAGEVVEMSVAPGEYRQDPMAPVMSVADLRTVWVSARVPERLLPLVAAGNRVTIALDAYPDTPVEARVIRVAPMLDATTRTATMIAELPNPHGRFRPEMFARVRYAGPTRSVVTVPVGAVINDDARTSVFVERARGRFERLDVTIGPRHDRVVAVTHGLAAGDRVVIEGTMLLLER